MLALTHLGACGDVDEDGGSDETAVTDAVLEACDDSKRPILFVHGGFGAGDQFTLQAQRLSSNGYCESHIRTFDYDSQSNINGARPDTIARLDAAVDKLIEDTGVDRIDMLGHSQGCMMSRDYLADAEHSAKIAHYINVAGLVWSFPDDVEVMGLTSEGDAIVGRVEYEGAENPEMPVLDHIAILTAVEPFEAIYEFFNDAPPQTTDVVPSEVREVSGFVKTFADNAAAIGTIVEVWELETETGERVGDSPAFELETDEEGAYGPFQAKADTFYEFHIADGGEDGAPLHLYAAPFERTMHLMYLKTMPSPGSIAGSLLSGLAPFRPEVTGAIVQHTNHGIAVGRDSLMVDGMEVAVVGVADLDNTTVAIFLADANDNGISDGTPLAQLAIAPFLEGIDVFIPSDLDTPLVFEFNGERIVTPRWPADPDGSISVMFANE